MSSRTRRCVVESTLFTSEKSGPYRIHRRRDFPAEAALEVAELHTRTLAGEDVGCRLCKKGQRTAVTLSRCNAVPPLDADRPAELHKLRAGTVCVKSFLRDSARDRLKHLFRFRSRAMQAWIALRGCNVRGLPAARSFALLERRNRFCGEPNFLIMENLEGARNLHDYVSSPLPQEKRQRLGEAVANLLIKLSENMVFHPDVKPTNVLVRETEDDLRLWLVDMARVRFDSAGGKRRWVRYLTQLNAGLSLRITLLDRMRGLRACARGRWSDRERLWIARTIYRKSLLRGALWLK